MGKIYCIVGKSGVGKDTLFDKIINDNRIKIKPIIPYTTRPKRINEIDGVTYNFVSTEKLLEFENSNKVIEKRTYKTVHGDWHYFTVDINIDLNNNNYIMITTLEAVDKLCTWYGNDNIIIIYLFVDDKLRLERSIQRESKQANPNYSEVCRRYLADEIDFSKDKINKYPTVFKIDTNLSIDESIHAFIEIIS